MTRAKRRPINIQTLSPTPIKCLVTTLALAPQDVELALSAPLLHLTVTTSRTKGTHEKRIFGFPNISRDGFRVLPKSFGYLREKSQSQSDIH